VAQSRGGGDHDATVIGDRGRGCLVGANLSGEAAVSVLFIVLPLALLTVMVAVLAYSWATRTGQFDDLDTPAMRVLHDDGPAPPPAPPPQ
jgi:cbb3-type cytochrome oxidase maturation protein